MFREVKLRRVQKTKQRMVDTNTHHDVVGHLFLLESDQKDQNESSEASTNEAAEA